MREIEARVIGIMGSGFLRTGRTSTSAPVPTMDPITCDSQRALRSAYPTILTLLALALFLQDAACLNVRPSGNPVTPMIPQKNMIYYNGGRLVTSANVYLIFYGDWSEEARNLTRIFIESLNDDVAPATVAGWWGITSQYYQAVGKLHVLRSYVRQKVREEWVNRGETAEEWQWLLRKALKIKSHCCLAVGYLAATSCTCLAATCGREGGGSNKGTSAGE